MCRQKCFAWWGVVTLLAAATAQAGTGTQASLPIGAKITSGLRVDLDTTWVDANGYRPVQITVTNWPPGPAAAERTIRVEFKPNGWLGWQSYCGVTDYIVLPQNAASVTATLLVPQREQWTGFSVEFYEDGERLKDLSYLGGMAFTGNYGWSEASPAMLFIDVDAPPRAARLSNIASLRTAGAAGNTYTLPDVRALVEVRPSPDLASLGYNAQERVTDLALLESLSGWSKMEILPPSDLPESWLAYTGFDLVFLSLDDLRTMVQHHPQTWRAVRHTLATGPTLCVYDVGEDFSRLEELEQLLDLPAAPEAASAEYRGWKAPRNEHYTHQLAGAGLYYGGAYPGLEEESSPTAATGSPNAPSKPTFVWRRMNLGRVVAIAAENPFPGTPADWGWMLNTIGANDWMWYQRHGLSLNRRNLDYWNLLVPGVGMAPVSSFLVLISLFVVVIGPLNYWLLVRSGRLYLLLVTVPLGAIVVTLSLFGYAFLTDGLGVKARLRSYTEIDQRIGRSVSWSRQSYYAALTPSRGLEFPKSAAVYPIDVQPIEAIYQDKAQHWIDWEYAQTLAKGYLASRVTSQLMVVQARETEAQVEIDTTGKAPRATNRLGTPLEFLVICDPQGNFFATDGLAEGQTAALSPIAWPDAAERLERAMKAVRPANPKGYNPREHSHALDFGNSAAYWWAGHAESGLSEPTVATSVLERALQRLVLKTPDALPPGSYAALAPHSPEVPLGVEQVKQMQSLHVIVGRW